MWPSYASRSSTPPRRTGGATSGCFAWTTKACVWPSRSGLSRPTSPTGTEPAQGSGELVEEPCVDVVQEAPDGDPLRDERVRAHLAHVVAESAFLVRHHAEVLPGRVLAGRGGDAVAKLVEGRGGHRTPGVGYDEDPLHVQQVDAEHERLEGLRGDAATGVPEDLGVPGREAQHLERSDPGVHAGDDRDPGVGDAVEAGEVEGLGELPVGCQQVVEFVVHMEKTIRCPAVPGRRCP